jgi:hypothetical protein
VLITSLLPPRFRLSDKVASASRWDHLVEISELLPNPRISECLHDSGIELGLDLVRRAFGPKGARPAEHSRSAVVSIHGPDVCTWQLEFRSADRDEAEAVQDALLKGPTALS